MNVLVVGSGGREHALVWKIAQSKKVKKLFCAPGNAGTDELAENVDIAATDIKSLLHFAKDKKIDLTVVGPEDPLVLGISDLFQKNHLKIIGPSKKAARIEGSKIFAKRLMTKYGIPTARFAEFNDVNKAKEYIKNQKFPLVIKASGPCLGKGVFICANLKEGEGALKRIMIEQIFGKAGDTVVIEEYLTGQELSFVVATDGKDFVSLLPSQDHKQIYDGDKGPNTGGIGAYAPVPFVHKELISRLEKEIVRPTIDALAKEGSVYRGILYPGLILTDEGPKVLEFNCRMGDPETQPVLLLLGSDIISIFEAVNEGKVKTLRLKWKKGSAVCLVLTSGGYPGTYEKGKVIRGLEKLRGLGDIFAFHSGTKLNGKKIVTNGGRVLGITGIGKDLSSSIKKVYNGIGKDGIHFQNMHYRKDIGQKGLKQTKITYSQVGDDYDTKDPVLRLYQNAARETTKQLTRNGFKEIEETRGASAFVWEQDDCYMATVLECLGTKNLVADAMRKITNKTYYDVIAHDTVATFINDLSTVGAKPLVVQAYWAIQDNSWLQDLKRMTDFINGWKNACIYAGATWGGGETPTLKGIVESETADLAGSVVGIIKPKKRLITENKLKTGDRILLLKSNGLNANGISLARAIVKKLPNGYSTKLSSGKMYGEEILRKSNIYATLTQDLLNNNIDIHYIVNITGHGLRKIMRARQEFSYIIEQIYEPLEVFRFIQKNANLSDYEMYQTYNMGMDYAIFLAQKDVEKAQQIIKKNEFSSVNAGYVEEGKRQVVIKPKNLVYKSETYNIR